MVGDIESARAKGEKILAELEKSQKFPISLSPKNLTHSQVDTSSQPLVYMNRGFILRWERYVWLEGAMTVKKNTTSLDNSVSPCACITD